MDLRLANIRIPIVESVIKSPPGQLAYLPELASYLPLADFYAIFSIIAAVDKLSFSQYNLVFLFCLLAYLGLTSKD